MSRLKPELTEPSVENKDKTITGTSVEAEKITETVTESIVPDNQSIGQTGVKLKEEEKDNNTEPYKDTVTAANQNTEKTCDISSDNGDRSTTPVNITDTVTDDNSSKGETILDDKDTEEVLSGQCGNKDKTEEIEKEVIVANEAEVDKVESAELLEAGNEVKELKTKLKGDMVVVGHRVSPSSESSENKGNIFFFHLFYPMNLSIFDQT